MDLKAARSWDLTGFMGLKVGTIIRLLGTPSLIFRFHTQRIFPSLVERLEVCQSAV
jgi:hypothetical protein